MVFRRVLLVLATIVLLAGCRRSAVPLTYGPTIPTEELLYRIGLEAFGEATPEGYLRASDAFRKASLVKPRNCDYALSRAQSLMFLALEQRWNFEDFEPQRAEAVRTIDSVTGACASHEPIVLRLRALLAGRGREGSDLVNRAVDLNPDDAMNWLVHAKVDSAGRFVDGQQQIAVFRAAELAPDSALVQFERGDYLITRKPEEAKSVFERVIELSPRHFRAYLGLAYSASVDENADVEPYYRKVVEIAPKFIEGRMAAGAFYGGLDEIDQAAEQYNAAIAANPKYDVAHFRLGLLAMYVEKPDEAERHFKAVIELNPNSYEAYYYLGSISYNRGDLFGAQTQYEKALSYRINYIEPNYGLGLVFRRLGNDDQALEQFEKVIRFVPDYPMAYTSRAEIRANRGQLAAALSDFERGIVLFERQIRELDAKIIFAETKPESRFAQADKKRSERDKRRVQTLIQSAQEFKAIVEQAAQSAQ